MEDYELFDRNTKAFIFGTQTRAGQRMLDFDYLCQRDDPSVAGFITPTGGGYYKLFWGTKEIRIPRYRSIAEAAKAHPEADVGYPDTGRLQRLLRRTQRQMLW